VNGFLWQQIKLWVNQGMLGCQQADRDAKDPLPFSGGFRRRRLYGILDAREPTAGMRFLKVRSYLGKDGWKWTGDWLPYTLNPKP